MALMGAIGLNDLNQPEKLAEDDMDITLLSKSQKIYAIINQHLAKVQVENDFLSVEE